MDLYEQAQKENVRLQNKVAPAFWSCLHTAASTLQVPAQKLSDLWCLPFAGSLAKGTGGCLCRPCRSWQASPL